MSLHGPNPPLHDTPAPEWISLRHAAEEWARRCDGEVNHYLDMLMRSFWLGNFDKGDLQLFTFEVPDAYRHVHRKDDVEERLGPSLRTDFGFGPEREDKAYVLLPLAGTDDLPIVVQEEATDGILFLHPCFRVDDLGEVIITTMDEQGNIFDRVIQQRDHCYRSRFDVMACIFIDELKRPNDLFWDATALDTYRNSQYERMAKRAVASYSVTEQALVSRLHIHRAHLKDWAGQNRLRYPFDPVPKSRRSREPLKHSNADIDKVLQDYLGADGRRATQHGAIGYVQERLAGAARNRIRARWKLCVPEDQRRPGPRPNAAR
jgi:hypothetical protein